MQDWLNIARNQAEERFRSLPMPSPKDENFRNTSLEDLRVGATTGAPAAALGTIPAELSARDEEECALLSLRGEEAHFDGQCPGAMFVDLNQAVLRDMDGVRALLRDPAAFRDDKFAQLTAARWSNGAFLHVPAGVKLSQPVRVATAATETEVHQRHVVQLGEGAEATIFLENWSASANEIVGEWIDLRLAKDAKLHWVLLQRFGENTKAVLRQRVEIAEGAELKITPVHLGGKKIQVRQEVELLGDSASLQVEAAASGIRDQHFDFWLDVRHAAPRTLSEMNYWFVMNEKARAVFNGMVHILPGAADCSASQKSKSLLLSPKATVHSDPKLIIQHDAVKCSHGASISSVSPEQIHYLQSRGITRTEAERMIVRGFTEHVFARVPNESFQARVSAELDGKEGGMLQ